MIFPFNFPIPSSFALRSAEKPLGWSGLLGSNLAYKCGFREVCDFGTAKWVNANEAGAMLFENSSPGVW